jgi:uncharacterized repeat protein (TIGR01451 family)
MKAHRYIALVCLLSLLLPILLSLSIAKPAVATLTDTPVAWSNFNFVPVTYNGGIIYDYESSSDPSRGTAAINPANTDISSCSPDGYLPGNQPSFLWSYYDSGTPSVIADDRLALRMRLNGTVLENSQVGLDSGHWYILIDIDNDGWKEFAIDIDGTVGSNRPDRVYLLYNDLPTNSATARSAAQRSNSDTLGGDEINLWYAAGPAATGIAQTNNHVRVLTATPNCFGGSEYWLDVQLPISAFNVGGIQKLDPSTPARFLISTSASASDPLQKDWMLKILSDPIFSDTWQPSVHASKSAFLLYDLDSNGTASPGDILRYDISITNTGQVPMLNVVFSDNISDSNLQLNDNVVTTAGTIVKGNTIGDTEVRVNISAIASGSSENISFQARILNNFPLGVSVVSNQGLVYGSNFTSIYTDDPATAAPSDATRTQVTIPPTLHITKQGPDEANSGSYITFSGTLSNFGTGPAENVTLVDQLPTWMTFVSSSYGAVYNPGANTVTWQLGRLEGGASISGWLTVLVDNATPPGSVLTNTFSVTWQDSGGGSYGPATATKNVTIRNRPILSISKSGPATGSPGNLLTYTGTLTNEGIVTATNVILVDHLPTGLTLVDSSHGAVYDPGTNSVTWNLGNVGGGALISGWLTVRVDSGVPNGTVLTNNFSLTWQDSGGGTYGPETNSANTTIYTSPQITISKEGPHEATVGSYITFTGTLTNVGGSTAENVILVDYLPPGLIFIGSSHSAVYDPIARTITWQLGSVGSGVSIPGWVEVRVNGSLPDGTDLINTFSVTWKDGGGASYGPSIATADVIARTSPILTVTKSGPTSGSPGGVLTYSLVVTNSGGLSAQNVILTDVLPDKYTYISSNPPGSLSGGNIFWNLNSLTGGGNTSVSVTVRVNDGVANETPLINTAIVNWQDAQGNSHGPASSNLTTTIYTVPHLTVIKRGPSIANPGINCTYSITLVNSSSAAATSVTLVDYIPAGMNYISSSPSGVFIGDNVTWNLGTVAGGATSSVSIILQVDPSLAEDKLLTDTAVVYWKDVLNNNYGPDSNTAQTNVYMYPQISLSISGPDLGAPCDTLTFRLKATNTSLTLPSNNVIMQYILPSGTAYLSSSDGGSYANGVVVWNLGTIAAGGFREVSLTITYCVIPVGSEIISTAAVAWQYPVGTMHGPIFASTRTRIVAVITPIPTPAPAAPAAPQRPVQSGFYTTPHSATMTRPWEPPIQYIPDLVVTSSTLSSAQTKTDMPVTVEAIITNRGTASGSINVSLYVNGQVESTQTVSLGSGNYTPVSFNYSADKPGEYEIKVNNTPSGTLYVEQNINSDIILYISMACVLTSFIMGVILVWRRINSKY